MITNNVGVTDRLERFRLSKRASSHFLPKSLELYVSRYFTNLESKS